MPTPSNDIPMNEKLGVEISSIVDTCHAVPVGELCQCPVRTLQFAVGLLNLLLQKGPFRNILLYTDEMGQLTVIIKHW